MRLARIIFAFVAAVTLSACSYSYDSAPEASAEEVAQAYYAPSGGPKLTLMTSLSNANNSGAHTALMISASQQVMFDPAGSWSHPQTVERGDVIYGFTPRAFELYQEAHARKTYHQIYHEIPVTAEQAEKALALAMVHGRAADATCAISVSTILQQIGLPGIRPSYFPKAVMRDVANLPGARTWTVRNDLAHEDKNVAIAAQANQGI